MSKPKKTRWFVITQWNMDCDYEELLKRKQIRYIAYGQETCPETNRPHHQAYVYMHNLRNGQSRKVLSAIGKMFGPTHCNVEPMYGSILQNESYCSKENELTKHGDEPKQGARMDLDETKDEIMKGDISVEDIAVECPMMYHQYGRTLEKIEQIALRKKWRTWKTEGTWIYGDSGTGKSTEAFKNYNPETHYSKNLNEDWWDGYTGQETVILNEFRGQIKFSELLDLVDMHPKTVRIRNREPVPFLAKKLIITSIKNPRECYPNVEQEGEPWAQFERRFKEIKMEQKCSEGNNETSEPKRDLLDYFKF